MFKKIKPTDEAYVKRFWPVFLLCLFFGILGLHRFYTGYHRIGRVYLLCAFTGIGTIISGLWSLADLLLISTRLYTTPNGRPLK